MSQPGSRVDVEFSDADLLRFFGERTLERGRAYFDDGHVLSCHFADGIVRARVLGADSAPYEVSIELGDSPLSGLKSCRCACPAPDPCKHAAATLLAALAQGTEVERDAADEAGARGRAAPSPHAAKPRGHRAMPPVERIEALGVRRLAEAVAAQAVHDRALRFQIVLEIAALDGPDALAAAADRFLDELRRDRGWYDWEEAPLFAGALAVLVRTLSGALAAPAPVLAGEGLWRLLESGNALYGKVDDSGGTVGDVFRAAMDALNAVWAGIDGRDRAAFAKRALAASRKDEYGVLHDLLRRIPDALGPVGAVEARKILEARVKTAAPKNRPGLLGDLADLEDGLGDLDAYMAAVERSGHVFNRTNGIVERLLKTRRAKDAADWIRKHGHRVCEPALAIRAFEAAGDFPEAFAVRWALFERSLDPRLYDDCAARAGDGQKLAEDALASALQRRNPVEALAFGIARLDDGLLERLALQRLAEFAAKDRELLVAAAERLRPARPAAAAAILRHAISTVLDARHAMAYAKVAELIIALKGNPALVPKGGPSHAAFEAALRRRHPNKPSVWRRVDGATDPSARS